MTDEFYYKDLRGLQIKIEGSIQKGFVNHVCNFGSGDLLEVSLDDSKATIYIPFDKDNVSRIDLAHKTITLTPLKRLTRLTKINLRNMNKTKLSTKVITLYPELFPGPLSASVTGRALKKRIWELELIDLRQYGRGIHKQVDCKPASAQE